MAHGMKFPLDEGLEKKFQSERGADGSLRWIKILINKERFEEAATGEKSDDAEKDVAGLAATISNEKEPFFALVRADGAGHWVQLAYVPDDSAVKVRMLYAGSIQHLKETLGSAVVASAHLTSKGEVCWKEVSATAEKVLSKAAPDTALMTPTELERHKQAQEASADAGASTGAAFAGVKFPLNADAKERLEAFAKGALSAVAFKIGDKKPEEICACDATKVEEAGAPAEAVVKTVDPKGESRYILYRFSQEEEGEKKDSVLFVYYASSGTPVKRRMLYASGKAACVHYATEAGAAPVKTLEYDDLADLTDKAVAEALKPSSDEPEAEERETAKKPKPPAKGMRMLIA
eukprot:TRINITY_DN10715_c0_g1_i2.p1 TRINITY_DN10715_c0_g1~~TRINITY_DN10715_c0_g1_i2.p1  ORF type:complete len:376 (+),score=153.47 TRINITY_DN10715_c0_g1_i2:85-1128(+)